MALSVTDWFGLFYMELIMIQSCVVAIFSCTYPDNNAPTCILCCCGIENSSSNLVCKRKIKDTLVFNWNSNDYFSPSLISFSRLELEQDPAHLSANQKFESLYHCGCIERRSLEERCYPSTTSGCGQGTADTLTLLMTWLCCPMFFVSHLS